MSLVSGPALPYIGTDQILVDQIVYELKSQGIFDSFRKECIADVDTKPAYQNLRQRVEGSVSSFLKEQKWKPESNKNQLRETLRKNIYESGFLETGVERIVSQVVNPKINTVFLPKVKEIFYKYIGLQTPAVMDENSFNIASVPKAEVTCYIETDMEVKLEAKMEIDSSTQNLLPTDLEAVSPDIDNILVADNNETNHDSNFMAMDDDDDTSPPFEPIDEDLSFKLIPLDENSIDSHLSGMSGLVSHDSQHSNKDSTVVMQQLLESDSQISKNSSSDDRLSIVTDDASNTKVDMLVVNDGVVVVLESTPSSKDNENSTDNKIVLVDVVSEVSQDTKSKDAIDKEKNTIDHLESIKSEFKIKDEIFDEDSKTVLSSELSGSAAKQSVMDSISKHSTCKKSTKDYKIDSSKHSNNSKSKDKPSDSNDCRENKEKSSNTKVSRSIKDNKSKSSSSTSSNRHSADNDKDRSANSKKYSSSSSKDKEKSTVKNKSSTTNSNDKDKSKDRDVSTNTNKEKESSTSSKNRESSSRDYSSSKSSTSSSRDKSASKDYSKDSKSRNSSSSSKHRSSSSRKYSSSSTTRNDDAKSHASSSSSKDRRDKRDSNIKDDHFSSKSSRIERRSTDRDSNDGQARNKGSTTSNDSTLLVKIEEPTSNNNTTEDSNSSNSKDGSNSDCCQNGEGNKAVSDELYVKKDDLMEVTDNLQFSQNGESTKKLVELLDVGNDKMIEVVDNCSQPIVPLTIMTNSEIKLDCKELDNILEDSEEKDNATLSLVTVLTQKTTPMLVESITSDVVETLDAIKSHLVEYKSHGHNDSILLKIKLPKVASNFREARKIMKLRKQLKQHNKLTKLITKENNSYNENAEPLSIGKVINGEIHDDIESNVTIKETTSGSTENSLLLVEEEIQNDGTVINTSEKMKIDNIVKKETTKTNYNDDCFYLDQVTDKTMRYLNYTASFIDSLDKEIQVLVSKMSVPVVKRKFSTVSSDSSVHNDNIGDQDSCSKVACSTSPPLALQTSTENIPIAVAKRKGKKRKFSTRSSESSTYNDISADQNSSSSKVSRNTSPSLASKTMENNITVVRKRDIVPLPSGEDSEGVTSATAHVQVVKQRRLYNSKATQRYTSDDLYKPRPFLKGTTKRTSGRVGN